MTDKDLIEWLIRIVGILLGVLVGLIARELYYLRSRVHNLENFTTQISIYLSLAGHKMGMPWVGKRKGDDD